MAFVNTKALLWLAVIPFVSKQELETMGRRRGFAQSRDHRQSCTVGTSPWHWMDPNSFCGMLGEQHLAVPKCHLRDTQPCAGTDLSQAAKQKKHQS